MPRKKIDNVKMADVTEARMDELRSAEDILKVIHLKEGDPTVKLPLAPVNLKGGNDGRFKAGNEFDKAHPGAYRVAIGEAYNKNPQLWARQLNRMTPAQRNFMVMYTECIQLKDCYEKMAEKYGDDPAVWYNRWRSWSEIVREAILYGAKALQEDATNAALALKSAYLTKAVKTYVDGLDSEDEKVRLDVAKNLIEQEFGKPGVRITTDNDGKYDELMERIAAATERAAGMPVTIEGAVVIMPEEEAEES